MHMIYLQVEIFCLITTGYVLSKKELFDKHTQLQLINILITIILPCATIKSFEINIRPKFIILCLSILVISFLIQMIYSIFNRIFYKQLTNDKKKCCQYATIVSNSGFMGMPLAQSLYGHTGLLYASIFLIPQRIFMWSSGLTLFEKKKPDHLLKKVLFHPCILAIYIGIIVMILQNLKIYIPGPINDTLTAIGNCNTAVSMFIIGGILSDIKINNIIDKEIIIYSFYRLILLPFLVLIFIRRFPVDITAENLCILLSAMPAASTTAMLAQKYNVNPLFASKLVFVSTFFSLITLPAITWVLNNL